MSEIQVPEKFLKPFYKFHLSQINRAFKSDSEDWKVPVGGDSGASVTCHMVWVQGHVARVNRDEDVLVLSEAADGGHTVTVDSLSSSPGGCGWVRSGQYVQVVGQLVDGARLRCSKITNLTEDKHCHQMWDLEVAELHSVLTGKIIISDI